MEEHSGEWEMEEYRSDEKNRGKVSWVLDKGIGLGKKILFTGFVISSAPLTLPPLVIISAIGLVVSIPSGIFLASYVCSEKLMRKLLPIPDHEEEEEEEEERERRDVKRKIESEGLEDRNVDVSVEENGYVEDEGDIEGFELGKGKEEEEEVSIVVVSEIDESGGERLEEPVVVEQIVVEETEPSGGEKVVVEVTTVVVTEKENGVEEKEIERETKGSLEEIEDEGKIADENKTPQEISTFEGDQSAISTTTTELPVSQGAEETKDQAEISSEKAVQTTPSNNEAKKKKNVKKKSASQQPPPQKVLYNEKEIWEQIEAVRKIVGYKATAQKTSIEELKALYIFTGVEPPESFGEPSDLADVNNKLQFLKSIIGVN